MKDDAAESSRHPRRSRLTPKPRNTTLSQQNRQLRQKVTQLETLLSRFAQDSETYWLGRQAQAREMVGWLQDEMAQTKDSPTQKNLLILLEKIQQSAQPETHPIESVLHWRYQLEKQKQVLLQLKRASQPFLEFLHLIDDESGLPIWSDDVPIRVDSTLAHYGERPTVGDFRKLKQTWNLVSQIGHSEEK